MNEPLKPTIEALLAYADKPMTLDRLLAMSEVELELYLAEAIKVCPPIRGHNRPNLKSGGTVLGSFKGGKFDVRSPLAQKLSSQMTTKEKIALELAKAGMTIDDIKKK